MAQFAKSFISLLRDYAVQGEDAAGIRRLTPEIVPVTIVDDTSEYTDRVWPTFMAAGPQAAVAAKYSVWGLQAGSLPVKVKQMAMSTPGAQNVNMVYAIADIRAANQATITPLGLLRGQAAATASVLTGTTTGGPTTGAPLYWTSGASVALDADFPGMPFMLLPGESFWVWGATVNVAINAQMSWEECLFNLPNPVNVS